MKSNTFKDKEYIVYKHTSPSGKVYIGITLLEPEYRWLKNGIGYKNQPVFFHAIIKYGWINFKHEVLYTGLLEQEALKKEEELILQYKSYDRRYGYNVLISGHSYVGKSANKKQSRAITIDPKYELNGNIVIKKSLNGEVLEEFKSVNKAARSIEVNCETLRTKLKKHGQVYYDNFYLEVKPKDSFLINMYSLDDRLLKSFSSMAEAYRYLGKAVNKGHISRCLRGDMNSYCGYKWRIIYES